MNKRYFKLVGANVADILQIKTVLLNKTFYPEATSTPALPNVPDQLFDYRQLFVLIGFDKDGYAIVHTRQEYTTVEFAVNVIPTADWTTRYKLSIAPTITALPTYQQDNRLIETNTTLPVFLSYDYNLYNN